MLRIVYVFALASIKLSSRGFCGWFTYFYVTHLPADRKFKHPFRPWASAAEIAVSPLGLLRRLNLSREIVHSSNIFTLEDTNESQYTIKCIQETIQHINYDINHIFRHIINLKRNRAQLLDALTTHQSVVAPIRKYFPSSQICISSAMSNLPWL